MLMLHISSHSQNMLPVTWIFVMTLAAHGATSVYSSTQDIFTSVATSTDSASEIMPSTSTLSTLMSSTSSGPFCANGSLVGLEVECRGLWKTCLSIGRLLHDLSGRCYPLGDSTPCGGNGSLVLDARALREGRLHGVCHDDTCDGYSMAYDGRCYAAADVNGSLCGSGAVLVRHLLGGWECACGGSECPGGGASAIEQPEAPGRCVLPPFPAQEAEPFRVSCSAAVRRCLGQGALPFEGECYEPLSNATCAEGEWLTLNESAAEAGVLSAMCAPRRPCGERAQGLRATGRCHWEQQLRQTLCPGGTLFYAPTGDVVCSEDAHGSDATVRIVTECVSEESASGNSTYSAGNSSEETLVDIEYILESIPSSPYPCSSDNNDICQPPVDPPANIRT